MTVEEGELVWVPPDDAWATSRIGRFAAAARRATGRELGDYEALWAWSVEDLDGFWSLIADELDVMWATPPATMLADASMPGARWAPGAELNYAAHALRGADDDVVVVHRCQTRPGGQLTRGELRDRVARCRAGLVRLGVGRGDRVAAYLPNVPETLVAFLATASLGAVWTSCAPEFGVDAVVDRLAQVAPTVLLTVDGYRYGTRDVDRAEQVAAIRAALPDDPACVLVPYLDPDATLPATTSWAELLAEPGELTFDPVPFDHPLYVLYSSGTTGIPKAIVHGHGGIVLEHLKVLALHHDLGPDDVFTWFTTTGWMMWNYLVSGLLVGARIVLFDGDPGHPDLMTLWRLAADERLTVLGVSAGFLLSCRTEGLTPGEELDLSALRQVGSTGSPLPPEGFGYVRDAVGAHVQTASASGGTDVCTAFVGAAPVRPVHAGRIPCRCLGAAVEAWAPDGTPLVDERGELVITEPMPSMPVRLWGDADGSRYRQAYFAMFDGVWRHGDWLRITPEGECVITGRSDATLNRGGVRTGTSEYYRVVTDVEGVADALVVHLEDEDDAGGTGRLLLLVVPDEGVDLDDALRSELTGAIRERISPRHVPDELHAIPAVPTTLSGKKLEVPVKRILAGEPTADVVSEGSLGNPETLRDVEAVAAVRRGS